MGNRETHSPCTIPLTLGGNELQDWCSHRSGAWSCGEKRMEEGSAILRCWQSASKFTFADNRPPSLHAVPVTSHSTHRMCVRSIALPHRLLLRYT
ncbi:hypothetical protein GCK32_021165 [Trichostrongylus colubriformis]|uniref:Uncharacterized protein n=1 Tax=Trichostrongylus colubriformis TaxID=6319 RepID=A0AAN8II04_TRICO